MPIGDGTLLRAAIGGALTGVAGKFGIPTAAIPAITDATVTRVQSDPKLQNATNQEHPVQSRVVVGSTLALVGGAFLGAAQLVEMFRSGSIDVEMAGGALAAILGAGFALYGRLRSGLAPLFTRKKV